jgi:diamine N-acetyltransferase
MTAIELREILSDEDRDTALTLTVDPGQERFVAPVAQSFQDANEEAHARPRMWVAFDSRTPVGFVMISDDIPQETLDANPDLIGPFYLWRLLIDRRYQRRGYGSRVLDAVVEYVRSRGATVLWTSAVPGDGSPLPFYERYGFVATGRIVEDEVELRLDLA